MKKIGSKSGKNEDPLSLLVLFYIPYPHQLNQEVVRLIDADMVDIQIPKGESVLQKLKKETNFVLKQLSRHNKTCCNLEPILFIVQRGKKEN